MLRLALVANRDSGGSTDASALSERLGASGVYGIDEGERAAAAGVDRLVVAGGDGSIGPLASVARSHDLPLAVVATGTANDFARAHGLPLDVDEACALARSVDGAAESVVELGSASGRPFVNVASCGLAPAAAEAAKAHKRRLGALAYAVGALVAGLRAPTLHATVTVDGVEVFDGRAWQVTVAATGAFGGGAELDVANPHDGLLDVAVVEAGPRLGLIRRAFGMRRGHLAEQSGVEHARGRRVVVHVAEQTPWNVDGEVCGCDDGVFELAGSFRLVVPVS